MTLYYEDGCIIENHPDYAEFDDGGRLVIDMEDVHREEKKTTLLRIAASIVEDSDEYELVTEPEFEWVRE